MPVSEVRVNVGKNRLYLKLDGFPSDAEIEKWMEKVAQEAKKLRPPFDLVSDLTGFKPMSPDSIEKFKQFNGKFSQAGIRKAIHVDSSSTIGSMQLKRLNSGNAITTVQTVREADELLDSL